MDIATLPKGTPSAIVPGMIWMEPIANIRNRYSIDYAVPDDYEQRPESKYRGSDGMVHTHSRLTWDDVLTEKRGDSHYQDVLTSIRERGWIRPVTVWLSNDHPGEPYQFGDGHHRLAVAIDLGMEYIPVEAIDYGGEPVSDDSGSWSAGSSIATSNGHGRHTYDCDYCGTPYSTRDDAWACEDHHEDEDED